MARQDDMHRAAPTATRKLTHDDYMNFPDDGKRHELIDGVHYVTPAPELNHQEILARLLVALRNYLRDHRLGVAYPSPLDVILSDYDTLQPDIVFVSNERARILGRWIHGAPDLVIEILSPSTRRHDTMLKFGRYEALGVVEYWIVDPKTESIEVFRRASEGRFTLAADLSCDADAVVSTPTIPGFELPLRELFR